MSLTKADILNFSKQGESTKVEFKKSVPSKVRELSEEICAFANGTGGFILIGIEDDGKIIGCDISNSKRSAIQNSITETNPGGVLPMVQKNFGHLSLSRNPIISFDNDFFSITFYKVKNTKENTKEKLSEKTQIVFDAIKENPNFSAEQISELLGFTVDAVRHHIKILKKLNLIKHEGSTKKGYWNIIST